MRNACFRKLQEYCTQQKTRDGKAALTLCVENALSEALKLTPSHTLQVTSAKTPGWTAEDWELKHPLGRKHSWFHGSSVIPGWHWHVKPSPEGHTTSPAAPWLARSLLSFPWHENTTKEGIPYASAADGWVLGSSLHHTPQLKQPCLPPCVHKISSMDGAKGGVSLGFHSLPSLCSPQRPHVPSNDFYFGKQMYFSS